MPTLIVRTNEPLANIYARQNSGDWILTSHKKITALEADGFIEVHPMRNGDSYDRILRAEIVRIDPILANPRRKAIHFVNPVWVEPPPIIYSGSWVVKYIP